MEFLLLLLFLLPFFTVITSASSHSLRLDLLHRHQVNATLGSLTRPDRLRELLRGDLHRHVSITAQISGCNNNGSSFIGAPMTAGRDLGIGQYLVEVSVGSPPQKFRLIADTGSELTWMRCRYKNGDVSSGKIVGFEPEKSATFRTVDCSSRTCTVELMNLFSLTKCPTPASPCAYDYRYADGSEALGIFAYETVTVDFTNKLHHESAKIALDRVLVGCSQTLVGQTFQVADGVLGLAYSNQSFTSNAGQAFGATFSYCLVDHLSHMNRTSYLTFGPTFGPTTTQPLQPMRYTNLELDALSPFYAVNIKGISVGGTLLRIPSMVWAPAGGGGTIIDSGTSLTFLTQPAYQLVVGALDEKLMRFRRLGSDFGPLDYCFDVKGFDESVVPRLVIHFADGARFEPPVKSYVIDAAPGVKCLGLLSASWPGVSVIGNIMQQNHLWSFNLADRKLGFAPSSCV